MRLLHRSLPSLMIPARLSATDTDSGELPTIRPKCFTEKSFSLTGEVSGEERPTPPSPHPLQKTRVHPRMPSDCHNIAKSKENFEHSFQMNILPGAERSQGILDLTYTLNFSTPLLSEIPLNVGTKKAERRPRVSFSDVPITYSPSEFPINDSNSITPRCLSSSASSSTSSSPLTLAVLPPYPSSSVSCLERGTQDSGDLFSIMKPPETFSSFGSKSKTHSRFKERSCSQPTIASAFCSFLKNKSKNKKSEGFCDTLLCPSLSVTRSSSLLAMPSPQGEAQPEEGMPKDLRLNFDCESEREAVVSSSSALAEYKVNDLEILCPMTFKQRGLLSSSKNSVSSSNLDRSSKLKTLKHILSSPKRC